ncbi:MAG TPA: hypothetical protein DEH78_03900 [Solibacterales bacterium]|nr:hypothetical protein [Bryobacterales bacterium]
MWAGLFFVIFGSVLLLDRLDIIQARDFFNFWPVILVVVGFTKLVSATDTGHRIFAGLLVAVGGVLLSNRLGFTDLSFGQLWPLLIIAAGVGLLMEALRRPQSRQPLDTGATINEFALFGGSNNRYSLHSFDGGTATAIFGGVEADLTRCEIRGDSAEVNASAMFGGVVLRVPEHWNVVLRGAPIFGGFEDKTYHPKAGDSAGVKTLFVRGFAMFGGVEVKN